MLNDQAAIRRLEAEVVFTRIERDGSSVQLLDQDSLAERDAHLGQQSRAALGDENDRGLLGFDLFRPARAIIADEFRTVVASTALEFQARGRDCTCAAMLLRVLVSPSAFLDRWLGRRAVALGGRLPRQADQRRKSDAQRPTPAHRHSNRTRRTPEASIRYGVSQLTDGTGGGAACVVLTEAGAELETADLVTRGVAGS